MTALALLLAACIAPMPATPKLQLPSSEKPQLPLEQKTEANKTTPLELPAQNRSTQPDAVLRQMAQRQLYEAGYQPPNALLDGKVDRYTAMKQLYDAGYQPPNALLYQNR
jgi:hypothetical protein